LIGVPYRIRTGVAAVREQMALSATIQDNPDKSLVLEDCCC